MREERVGRRLGDLVGRLVGGCGLQEFLDHVCVSAVELLEVPAAAVMVTAPGAPLHVAAASDPVVTALEHLQSILEEGPGIDAHRTGRPVTEDDLARTGPSRWPRFAPACVRGGGVAAVLSVPMRVRAHGIGVLDVFPAAAATIDEAMTTTARSLADVATIGLLHADRAFDPALVGARLQDALRARVVLEQATGVLAELHGLSPAAASELLYRTAERDGRRPADVAREVVDRTLRTDA